MRVIMSSDTVPDAALSCFRWAPTCPWSATRHVCGEVCGRHLQNRPAPTISLVDNADMLLSTVRQPAALAPVSPARQERSAGCDSKLGEMYAAGLVKTVGENGTLRHPALVLIDQGKYCPSCELINSWNHQT